jgi:hypothetical protein
MAYDNRGTNLPGIVAAADYSAAQHRFVAINSSGKAALCAAGARVDAVLDNNPAADQACSLMGPGSVSKVEASAAIAFGAEVASAADGKAVTASEASGDYVAGVAVTAAAGAGALVSVWLPFHGVREANGTKLAGFVANADYTSSSPRFVTINSSGKAELTGAGLVADGVMTNAPDADEPANISGPGYRGDVESGGAVTAGDNVASDATGRAVTAAAGDYIVGRALEAATGAGEGLDCWIHMPGIVETP